MTLSQALAVYAEPLLQGRRVALLGPEDPALLDVVVGLGARIVYVYDPRVTGEPVRRSEGKITVHPFRVGDLGVRDGAFDTVLVADLPSLGEAEASLAAIRRLIGTAGCALIASRNRDATPLFGGKDAAVPPPTYHELYDLCALQFADVRMIGVAPFVGCAVVDFAPRGESAVSFDGSLMAEPEKPEWYVALVSQRGEVALDPYEVIQISRSALAAPAPVDGRQHLAAIEQKLREAEARAGDQYVRAERLSNDLRTSSEELRRVRDLGAQRTRELEEERRHRQRLEQEVQRREQDIEAHKRAPELASLRERTLALEAELIEARTQLATPRTAPAEAARLTKERDALAAEVSALRTQIGASKMATDELRKRLAERDKELEASIARQTSLEDRLADQLAAVQTEQLEDAAARAEKRATAAEQRASVLEQKVTAAEQRSSALEQRVAVAEQRSSTLEQRASVAEQRASSAEQRAASIEQRAAMTEQRIAAFKQRAEQAEAVASKLEGELAAALVSHQYDVTALEAVLRERGDEMRSVRQELAHRERLVRELVAELEDVQRAVVVRDVQLVSAPAAEPNRELVDQLERARRELAVLTDEIRRREGVIDEERVRASAIAAELADARATAERLALEVAAREAELQTVEWKLSEASATPARMPAAASAQELDALRRALVQEHEQVLQLERRLQANGAQDLRSQLQEREALVAQLSAQLARLGQGAG